LTYINHGGFVGIAFRWRIENGRLFDDHREGTQPVHLWANDEFAIRNMVVAALKDGHFSLRDASNPYWKGPSNPPRADYPSVEFWLRRVSDGQIQAAPTDALPQLGMIFADLIKRGQVNARLNVEWSFPANMDGDIRLPDGVRVFGFYYWTSAQSGVQLEHSDGLREEEYQALNPDAPPGASITHAIRFRVLPTATLPQHIRTIRSFIGRAPTEHNIKIMF